MQRRYMYAPFSAQDLLAERLSELRGHADMLVAPPVPTPGRGGQPNQKYGWKHHHASQEFVIMIDSRPLGSGACVES